MKMLLLLRFEKFAVLSWREFFWKIKTTPRILLNPPQFNGLLIVDESILNSLRDSVALLNLAENW